MRELGLLDRIEEAAATVLREDPDFAGAPTIPVIAEGQKDFVTELQKRVLAGLVFVLMTADTVEDPVPGKDATIRLQAVVIEHVLHNRGKDGTGVNARTVAEMVKATLTGQELLDEFGEVRMTRIDPKEPPPWLGQDAESRFLVYAVTGTVSTILRKE